MEREKREKEEKHRQEMEEIQENFESQALAEAERNLMKIILPELLKLSNTRMQNEFCQQLEEKNSEIKRLRQMLILEETLRMDREGQMGVRPALLAVLNATRRYTSR